MGSKLSTIDAEIKAEGSSAEHKKQLMLINVRPHAPLCRLRLPAGCGRSLLARSHPVGGLRAANRKCWSDTWSPSMGSTASSRRRPQRCAKPRWVAHQLER
jgi:hypothetical protein